MAWVSSAIIECASKHRRDGRSCTQTGGKSYSLGFESRMLHIVNYRSRLQTSDIWRGQGAFQGHLSPPTARNSDLPCKYRAAVTVNVRFAYS